MVPTIPTLGLRSLPKLLMIRFRSIVFMMGALVSMKVKSLPQNFLRKGGGGSTVLGPHDRLHQRGKRPDFSNSHGSGPSVAFPTWESDLLGI